MKLGSENRKEVIALAIMLPLAILLAVYEFAGMSGTSTSTVAENNAPAAPRVQRGGVRRTVNNAQTAPELGLDPTLRLNQLKAAEDAKYTGSGRNIFQDQTEIEPPDHPVVQPHNPNPNPAPPVNPGPPPPPPITLKFYGFASGANEPKRIFLSQGDDIYIAREGEIVARRYRVVKINNNNVEIEDMQFNNKQAIPLSAQAPG